MAEPLDQPPRFETREAYYEWALAADRGRTELLDGEVIAMSPERVGHARAKAQAWLALRNAIAAAGLGCEALPDGVTVEIGARSAYEPDVVVHCGDRIDADALAAPVPIIVVEVTSPSNSRVDLITKTADYLRHPTIRHYVIVLLRERQVLHHRKLDDGRIETAILKDGALQLDPPGIAIGVETLFG